MLIRRTYVAAAGWCSHGAMTETEQGNAHMTRPMHGALGAVTRTGLPPPTVLIAQTVRHAWDMVAYSVSTRRA